MGLGANVFVTSGDHRKIERAVKLGAKGGVNYKSGMTHFVSFRHAHTTQRNGLMSYKRFLGPKCLMRLLILLEEIS